MFANLLAMFAQFERERIGERRREAGVKMRENGWWQGGQQPYGKRPVKVDNHWELRDDPAQKGIIERMAREVISGKSRRAIGRDLTADGIPTPKSAREWGERTITKILKSEDTPLDDDLRARVLEALDKTKVPWTKRGDAALLLNIAYCTCGEQLYARRWVNKKSGKLYEYYGCAVKCGQPNIPMADLEEWIDHIMVPGGLYGSEPVWRKVITGGTSNRALIMKLDRKIHALDLDADDYDEQLTALRAERKALKDAEVKHPASVDYEDTGMKVSDYWWTLDPQVQRQFLLLAGIKIKGVVRMHDGSVDAFMGGPWPVTFVMADGGMTLAPVSD
jgi:hypothetical protein